MRQSYKLFYFKTHEKKVKKKDADPESTRPRICHGKRSANRTDRRAPGGRRVWPPRRHASPSAARGCAWGGHGNSCAHLVGHTKAKLLEREGDKGWIEECGRSQSEAGGHPTLAAPLILPGSYPPWCLTHPNTNMRHKIGKKKHMEVEKMLLQFSQNYMEVRGFPCMQEHMADFSLQIWRFWRWTTFVWDDSYFSYFYMMDYSRY